MARKVLANIATACLAVAASASSFVVIRGALSGPSQAKVIPRASIQKDWRIYAQSGSILGDSAARVTIVEFSDFQCPYCQRLPGYLDSLRTLGRSVRVVYRHFPAPSHQHAVAAVRASECSSEQAHFRQMHEALTKYADSIGKVDWVWFARVAKMPNIQTFAACNNRSGPILALGRDTVAGLKLGVRGTPTILINDQRYNGLPPFDSLVAYVDRAERGVSKR